MHGIEFSDWINKFRREGIFAIFGLILLFCQACESGGGSVGGTLDCLRIAKEQHGLIGGYANYPPYFIGEYEDLDGRRYCATTPKEEPGNWCQSTLPNGARLVGLCYEVTE